MLLWRCLGAKMQENATESLMYGYGGKNTVRLRVQQLRALYILNNLKPATPTLASRGATICRACTIPSVDNSSLRNKRGDEIVYRIGVEQTLLPFM